MNDVQIARPGYNRMTYYLYIYIYVNENQERWNSADRVQSHCWVDQEFYWPVSFHPSSHDIGLATACTAHATEPKRDVVKGKWKALVFPAVLCGEDTWAMSKDNWCI